MRDGRKGKNYGDWMGMTNFKSAMFCRPIKQFRMLAAKGLGGLQSNRRFPGRFEIFIIYAASEIPELTAVSAG